MSLSTYFLAMPENFLKADIFGNDIDLCSQKVDIHICMCIRLENEQILSWTAAFTHSKLF